MAFLLGTCSLFCCSIVLWRVSASRQALSYAVLHCCRFNTWLIPACISSRLTFLRYSTFVSYSVMSSVPLSTICHCPYQYAFWHFRTNRVRCLDIFELTAFLLVSHSLMSAERESKTFSLIALAKPLCILEEAERCVARPFQALAKVLKEGHKFYRGWPDLTLVVGLHSVSIWV